MKIKDVKSLKDMDIFEDYAFANNPNVDLFLCMMFWKTMALKLAKAIEELVP